MTKQEAIERHGDILSDEDIATINATSEEDLRSYGLSTVGTMMECQLEEVEHEVDIDFHAEKISSLLPLDLLERMLVGSNYYSDLSEVQDYIDKAVEGKDYE